MLGFLIKFRAKRSQALKEKVLNNREALLNVMSDNIKGASLCPALLGEKCIGEMCVKFKKYTSTNGETGKKFTYHRCVDTQTDNLIIETNELLHSLIVEQRKTQELLIAMVEK